MTARRKPPHEETRYVHEYERARERLPELLRDWFDYSMEYKGQTPEEFGGQAWRNRQMLQDATPLELLADAAPFLNRGLAQLLGTPLSAGNLIASSLGAVERDPRIGARHIEALLRQLGIPVPDDKEEADNLFRATAEFLGPLLGAGPQIALAKGAHGLAQRVGYGFAELLAAHKTETRAVPRLKERFGLGEDEK